MITIPPWTPSVIITPYSSLTVVTATAMYYTGKNPLRKVTQQSEQVYVPKGARQRRLHKAFLRYHDANNWPVLRDALKRMGRADLIGNGKRHLVPAWQPSGTGEQREGQRTPPKAKQSFRTQHNRAEKTDHQTGKARRSSQGHKKHRH